MARLILLAIALFSVAGQGRADEGLFENGQEYQYTYSTSTMTGVREPAPFGSSFGIRGNLVIQMKNGEAVAKLSDLTMGMHNGPESLLPSVKYQKKPELSFLEKPFKMSFLKGKINGFDADASDAEWSINIKKGLATVLQVDLNDDPGTKGRSIEDTVVGTCNTTYSYGAGEKGRRILIKQRSATECVNVPRIAINTFGSTNCAGRQEDDMISTTQTYYQFTPGSEDTIKAHVISSFGYQVLQIHPPAGTPFYNLANTTLVLRTSGPISKPIPAGSLTKHYGSLRYSLKRPIPTPDEINLAREEDFFHPEEPLTQQLLRTKATALLNKVKEVIATSPLDEANLQDPSVTAAIQMFAGLNLDSLTSVLNSVEKNEELRNLFIEILPLTGSNPAALKIKEMIMNGKMTEVEARRAVAFLPYYLRLPSEKLLAQYEELLKENANIKSKELKSAIVLAFGHLVGVTCTNKLRPCKADTLAKYGRMGSEAFRNAKTHPEMMVILQAIRNSKQPSFIERLVPLVRSGAVSHALRPHIIYALQPLARTSRNKFLSAVMPIILNGTETTEVRIAAIASLLQTQPTFLEIQQLIAGAVWERNQEVLNFLVTSLRNAAETKNPCIKPMTNQLQLLLRRIAHIKTDPFRSSHRIFDFQDEKYGFGGGLQLATVYGEESRAPVVVAGRASYRLSDYTYVPIEFFVRIEGADDTFVRLFRKLDPKDFKLDALKDLLQKTMKIQPRQQAPLKLELLVRSQGYSLMYRHMGMEELVGLMEGKGMGEMLARGLKLTRSMVMLGGHHTSWRANDVGLPVGVGLSNPGFARYQFNYGSVNQPGKIGRSILADLDFNLQTVAYLVAFNPLGASQGIVKVRGSRVHLPANVMFNVSPVDSQIEIKINNPTEEKPLSYVFSSKTMAFMHGKDDTKAVAYLKDTCSECETQSLVTKGEKFRKGQVIREKNNQNLGLESHVEVYNCETYTGKASIANVIYQSFKPSEINSHGSVPGFLAMGFMQMRNYFYYYPPTGTCSMKAVVHKGSDTPSDAAELKLKMDSNVPAGKKAAPGKSFQNIKGSLSLTGSQERKWNIDIAIESEPFNVKSQVGVKIARQANAALEVPSRALCVNVKTAWAVLPDDIMETPSSIEPSVQRDVTFVWGDAPNNECPKPGAKGVSTIHVKAVGNITDAQREAATERTSYPFDRCDFDRTDAGRTGVTTPMTEACYQAVMQYATPASYVFDIHYENLSPAGMMTLKRAETMLKASLLPYWTMHPPQGATAVKKAPNAGHIQMKMEFGEEDVDLHVHTDVMHNHFENVDMLKNMKSILRNARFQLSQLTAVKAGWVGICDVAPKAVVTFDNVTMNYDLPPCYTLVSADCSATPRFAAFAKKVSQQLPLAAKIFVGGHSVELTPTGSNIEVKVNDKVVKVDTGKPFVLADKENIVQYIVVTRVGTRYFIQAPMLKLTFRYTGDDITNMIPATYRAQHCGICGDYNGQFSRELVSPSGCNVKDATDLARSYVLRDKNCKESIPNPPCAAEPMNIGRTRRGVYYPY